MSKPTVKRLALSVIRTDGGTQCRADLSQDTIQDYAEAMEAGAEFPAVDTFFDGKAYWLADGFQRVEAARKVGLKEFLAVVHKGTLRDAILFAAGANTTHGLRRSNSDKRRAVEMLLVDEEWSCWSDREVARRCGVSDRFVNGLRTALSANGSQIEPIEKKVTRKGTTYTMKAKGTTKTQEPPTSKPAGAPTPSKEDWPPRWTAEQIDKRITEARRFLMAEGRIVAECMDAVDGDYLWPEEARQYWEWTEEGCDAKRYAAAGSDQKLKIINALVSLQDHLEETHGDAEEWIEHAAGCSVEWPAVALNYLLGVPGFQKAWFQLFPDPELERYYPIDPDEG